VGKSYQKKEEINGSMRRGCRDKYLLPEMSMSLIATAIQGSIKKVVNALIRNDAEVAPIPRSERRTSTPASSRIWGV